MREKLPLHANFLTAQLTGSAREGIIDDLLPKAAGNLRLISVSAG